MGREEVEEVKRGARGEEKVRRQRLKMMADNGVKPHTTVTVTTQSGLAPQDSQPMEIRLNIGYFKSFQGIIKIVQLVLGIICMACAAPAQTISVPDYFGLGHNHFFLLIVVLSGFGWCTTSHRISSTICDARVAAGVFGIFNSIAYGLGTYLTYQEYNNTPPELQ